MARYAPIKPVALLLILFFKIQDKEKGYEGFIRQEKYNN